MRFAKTMLAPAFLSLASWAHAAPPELRGTWITTTGLAGGNVSTPANSRTNFQRLRNVGLNTIYMDAWRNGSTYFRSDAVAAITGRTLASELGTRDLFAETLIQSHRNQMHQVGWLQYGFAAQFIGSTGNPSNTLATYMNQRGWLLKDNQGRVVNNSNSFAWMNPLVPEVRKLLIDMSLEMVRKYDVDGVQFDDRLAWPIQFGFDDVTRDRYLAETGRNLPTSHTDAAFTAWRSSKVTEFAREWSTAIRAANPNILISVTPAVHPWAYANYCVNWPDWIGSTVSVDGVSYPLVDEVIPQVYRSTASSFNNEWANQLNQVSQAERGDLGAGISINNSAGAPYDWTNVNLPQVNSQRNASGTAGHVWWYSSGVLDAHEDELTALYNVVANGQASRPDRDASWRPAPIVLASVGSGQWRGTIPETGRYRVVTRAGDTFTETLSTVLPAGTLTFASSLSVEVLVDRRGYIPADANFDFKIDLDDFFAVAGNFGQSGRRWHQGDFNLDGLVDARDFDLLALNWGVGIEGVAPDMPLMLPEPGMLSLLSAAVILLRRR
jgi:uncharacterized lipoprotein YddW (UPF0748 family)